MTTSNINPTFGMLAISAMILLHGCATEPDGAEVYPVPQNYILLLDLSDRLLAQDIPGNDQALILAAAGLFNQNARSNLTIRSSDKFKLRIVPQKGSSLDVNRFENEGTLDMARVELQEKSTKLVRFVNGLRGLTGALYEQAVAGKSKNGDFFGCDIWKYFHEQLQMDLEKGCDNHVIVLTDGYFDFENSAHAMCIGSRHTSSDFYAVLKGPDWRSEAMKGDLGFIPVNLEKPFRVIVCGLRPKNEKLTELDKLGYFWIKWMTESNADTCLLIPASSCEKMKNELLRQFNNNNE